MRKKVDTTVERGSGNVFADLGCSDADGRLAKAELARAIHKLIVQRAWTQPCLVALDMNVTIHVAPKSTTATRARLAVDIAAVGIPSAVK